MPEHTRMLYITTVSAMLLFVPTGSGSLLSQEKDNFLKSAAQDIVNFCGPDGHNETDSLCFEVDLCDGFYVYFCP